MPLSPNDYHTGLHQERAYTYSGISCPECVHQFFCCLLMHIMHFVCKLQLVLNVDTKVYAFMFIFKNRNAYYA